jgi:hypothetical protein
MSDIDDSKLRYPLHHLPQSQLLNSRNHPASEPSVQLVESRTRPLTPLPEIISSHFQFAINVLKDTPRMMVLQNQTPWCHPSLYRKHMPRAMQGQRTLLNPLGWFSILTCNRRLRLLLPLHVKNSNKRPSHKVAFR